MNNKDFNLPKVFANPINKTLTNNLDYAVSSTDSYDIRSTSNVDIPRKINEIFASPNHVYKSKVLIKLLNNEELETIIVGKTGGYLLTLNGDRISINNILNIEKI